MRSNKSELDAERLDRATASRLAKLRSMPIDTSRLERLVRARIPFMPEKRITWPLQWFQPMRAVAASFMVLAILGALLLSASGGPALASTAELARLHNEMITGQMPVTRVDSMQAANHVLDAQRAHFPQIPNMPADHVMACCMRLMKNKKVLCVLLKSDSEPVTLTVASSSDMLLPTSPTMTRNGILYHLQSAGSLNMVTTHREGRWVCLMAKLPAVRLIDLASSLQF